MTIGPAPMMRMEAMSVRRGIGSAGSLVIRPSDLVGVIEAVDRPGNPIESDSVVPDETPAAEGARDFGDDWVHELIAMTRPGVEINFPWRGLGDGIVPFEYDDFD